MEQPDDNSFEFNLNYNGQPVTCKVVMGESGYGILFDDQLITELSLDDNAQWEDLNEQLDPETVYTIGEKINDHYA
jgi:hypothetical protein